MLCHHHSSSNTTPPLPSECPQSLGNPQVEEKPQRDPQLDTQAAPLASAGPRSHAAGVLARTREKQGSSPGRLEDRDILGVQCKECFCKAMTFL